MFLAKIQNLFNWLRYKKLHFYKKISNEGLKPDIKKMLEITELREKNTLDETTYQNLRQQILMQYHPDYHKEIENAATFAHQFSKDIKESWALNQLRATNKITQEEYASLHAKIAGKYSPKDSQDLENAVQGIESK